LVWHTREGLDRYDGIAFTQFTVDDGLISDGISCILEDKDGKIWIGSEAGLCVYDGKTFSKVEIPLRKDMPPNKQRDTHNVFSMMQDKAVNYGLLPLTEFTSTMASPLLRL
jgi:ligand-binding sensor domain-containing protein